jgi:phosphoribosylamine--glycine ligase
MKVLVIGKGAREHAIVWRLHQSESVWKIFCAPGNPGINEMAEPVAMDAKVPSDFDALADFVREKSIDLTVVGPEDPLGAGIVDHFNAAGLKIFGPTAAAAQLEISKAFAKSVMRAAGVPTADYAVFDDATRAREYIAAHPGPIVVKSDGLTLGKGVTVCANADEANAAIAVAMEDRKFGDAGARVVIEECLAGEEASFFALCDGTEAIALGIAQDHKRIFDGDRGPNTGGMGAYSPVPQFGSELELRTMREVVRPTLAEMAARGTPFRGVLFVGLMIDGDRINVIEFNARFGDPECEVLMMRFEGDLGATLLASAEGRLTPSMFRLSPRYAVTVMMASGGYPGEYRKGIEIRGLDSLEGAAPLGAKVRWAMEKTRVKVFHAGTAMRDGVLVTDGGRVLAVTALAPALDDAVRAAYEAVAMIHFEGASYRRDIAGRALAQINPNSGASPAR